MSNLLFVCCFVWAIENIGAINIIKFLFGLCIFASFIVAVSTLFMAVCCSCEVSSNQKKTSINENQTAKKTATIQFDVKPTKQYPVLDDIQKIISSLSELEKDNDFDKNMFAKFHKLKEQFDVDY